jgi:very-short-patch-repair endonuclease
MDYEQFHNRGEFKRRRQYLRSFATKAEYVLWQELRKEKLKYRFRRQFGIGPFIVDFYCPFLRLIIEVDGPIHTEQKEYDAMREEFLKSHGYIIVRVTNDEVLFKREKVIEKISDVCARLIS